MSSDMTQAVSRAIRRMDPALTLKMSSILADEIADTFLPLNREVYGLMKKAGRLAENIDLETVAKTDRRQMNELMALAGSALLNASENLFKIAQTTAEQHRTEQAEIFKRLREKTPEGELKIEANSPDGQTIIRQRNQLAALKQKAELYRLAHAHNEMVRYVAVELPMAADRRIGFIQEPVDAAESVEARLATDPRSTTLLMGQVMGLAAGRIQQFITANPADQGAGRLLKETTAQAQQIMTLGGEGMRELPSDQVIKLLEASSRQLAEVTQFARKRGLSTLADYSRAAAWHAGIFTDATPAVELQDVAGRKIDAPPAGNDAKPADKPARPRRQGP